MKLFLSWSTEPSRELAELLRDWLPDVVQAIEPWMSTADIGKGALWADDLLLGLQKTSQGIICITPGVGTQPWLNFEIGMLSKAVGVDGARVKPLLYKVTNAELAQTGPISLYQATQATNKKDMLSLVTSLNASCERPLADIVLKRYFDRLWPAFLDRLSTIVVKPNDPLPNPSQPDPLTEILELLKGIQRSILATPTRHNPVAPIARERRDPLPTETSTLESRRGGHLDPDAQRQLITAEFQMANQYESLGELAREQGNLAEADESLQKATELYSRVGDRVERLLRDLERGANPDTGAGGPPASIEDASNLPG